MAATILLDDLDTYISQYGTHGAVQRLQFIASSTSNRSLKIEASKLALDLLKRTTNAKGYTEAYTSLKELLESADAAPPHYDSVWVEATQKQANILKDLYEQDLHQAKSSQIKETIRNCFAQLTNLCIEQGDYSSAVTYASKSREYCTESEAVFSTCMTIIRLSALLRVYTNIQSFTSKAHHTPFKDETGQSKIYAAYGLYHMTNKKFRDAALAFAQVRPSALGPSFLDVLCPQDVAVYGVLCGLASLERNEVQGKLLESPTFRECLDLVPQIRDIALDFCGFKYAACLSALERLKESLSLDVHLSGQVADICQQIRSRGMVQYFAPFLSVSLHSMAQAFNTDVEGVQAEVAQLVGKRQLDAKIDSHRKILHVRSSNQRKSAYLNAMRVSQEFVDSTQALVLRMNLLKHDFGVHVLRPKK
uniref:PCI domain-containing protein n=1 Tax=Zooxanthella nutricula TaxID=1333877 RepID=A0A7S2K937_9DINO